ERPGPQVFIHAVSVGIQVGQRRPRGDVVSQPVQDILARRAGLDVRLDLLGPLGREGPVLCQVSAELRAGWTSDHDATSSRGRPCRSSISRLNSRITLYLA